MRAIYYEEFGGPEVLRCGERPKPQPAEGKVLVRVGAAGVNPIDRRLRSGQLQAFFQREWPVTPGWDFAGRIEAIGPGVQGWEPGQDVLGLAFEWQLHGGTYAEYVSVNAGSIAAKPDAWSFEQAASIPLVSLTAWQSLDEVGQLKPGQSVLIQAGAGGVGSVAIPMARHLGARIYTTARAANHEYVRALGADVAIDYTARDYAAALREAEPAGLDLVIESLESDEAIRNAVLLARPGAAVIYLNNEPPDMPEIAAKGLRSLFLHHRADGAMLADLVKLFESGVIPLPRLEVMPLEQAADAHRKLEQWRTLGKMVLHVQDI
jgi:NADPH:quinone reductase-like Zn-dependent oxidoreductase